MKLISIFLLILLVFSSFSCNSDVVEQIEEEKEKYPFTSVQPGDSTGIDNLMMFNYGQGVSFRVRTGQKFFLEKYVKYSKFDEPWFVLIEVWSGMTEGSDWIFFYIVSINEDGSVKRAEYISVSVYYWVELPGDFDEDVTVQIIGTNNIFTNNDLYHFTQLPLTVNGLPVNPTNLPMVYVAQDIKVTESDLINSNY